MKETGWSVEKGSNISYIAGGRGLDKREVQTSINSGNETIRDCKTILVRHKVVLNHLGVLTTFAKLRRCLVLFSRIVVCSYRLRKRDSFKDHQR